MKVINGLEHLSGEERLQRLCGFPGSLRKQASSILASLFHFLCSRDILTSFTAVQNLCPVQGEKGKEEQGLTMAVHLRGWFWALLCSQSVTARLPGTIRKSIAFLTLFSLASCVLKLGVRAGYCSLTPSQQPSPILATVKKINYTLGQISTLEKELPFFLFFVFSLVQQLGHCLTISIGTKTRNSHIFIASFLP